MRKAVLGGVAVLGAGVLLSACSSTQMGAAAIVGNQRISQSDLNTQVAALSKEAAAAHLKLPADKLPGAILSTLITFKIWNQTAAAKGISVTHSQEQAALASYEEYAMQQTGASSPDVALLGIGISSQLRSDFGQVLAEQGVLEAKLNGGKPPASQSEAQTIQTVLAKASCTTAKSMNIQVNPQFGQLKYAQGGFSVTPAPDLLSRTSTSTAPPSSAPTGLAC